MKNILVVFLLFTSTITFGQNKLSSLSTTEEEYNYLTKGYKVQIESGLDMKKGYSLKEVGNISRGKCDFNFKILIREAKNEIAGYLVITHSRNTGQTYYSCIPINNKELLDRYYDDIHLWDQVLLGHYCYIISEYLGDITSRANELEKKVN